MGGNTISKEKEQRNRVNGEIVAIKLRLISESGRQIGIVGLKQALQMAEEVGLDLVEIQPNAELPVAKIMDYGKYMFQQSKQKAAAKKKQKVTKIKEVKFRPTTDVGDYEVKLRSLRGFLGHGDKVKITIWFRGREMINQKLEIQLLDRLKADLDDIGKIEFPPRLEGRQIIMIMAPKKK